MTQLLTSYLGNVSFCNAWNVELLHMRGKCDTNNWKMNTWFDLSSTINRSINSFNFNFNFNKWDESKLNGKFLSLSSNSNGNNNNNNNGNGNGNGNSGGNVGGSDGKGGKSKKSENPFAKFIISGTVTIFFEAFAGGHYLEMIKILKQTSNDPYSVITKRMIAGKGIVGLLDGFMPWGALQSTVKGSSFGFGQAAALMLLHTFVPKGTMTDGQIMVLSGGLGGFTQGVIMSPMLLLKTRVMTDARFRTSGGFWQTSIHSLKLGRELIATEGGFMSLTKGMGIFSGKRFADWTTRYGFVVLVENQVKKQTNKKKLSKPVQAMCSLAGGTLSALVTVPIDVMVATVQQANKKGEKVSVLQIYKDQINKGGMKGMIQLSTRGLVPRVAHVAMTVLMMKTVSSWCYTFLANKFNW